MMAWDLCACPDPAAHQSQGGWERKVGSRELSLESSREQTQGLVESGLGKVHLWMLIHEPEETKQEGETGHLFPPNLPLSLSLQHEV